MKTRMLKSAVFGGSLIFTALAASAAMDGPGPIKSGSPSAAAVPTVRDSMEKSPAPTGDQASLPSNETVVLYSDAEILDIVNAVDENEINAAAAALKEKTGKETREFAKMLREQHRANLAETKKLSKAIETRPAECKTADALRAKGRSETTDLSALDGIGFEKAYIDAMVIGHTEALQLIDAYLLPSAKNAKLAQHLTAMREHVSSHLEHGKRLQGARASVE